MQESAIQDPSQSPEQERRNPVELLVLLAFDAELCAMEQVRATNHKDPFWQESKEHF